jgi:hypothetical protein
VTSRPSDEEVAALIRESFREAPTRTELAWLLDDLAPFVRRYVVMSAEQADAIALWIVHTELVDAFDVTAYLAVTSPEKRSGKTTLLEALELLLRTPLPTANISDAALFRAVRELSPTLLFDEVDAIFGPKTRDREDLRGMLNAGYRRGAVVYRMGGPKMTTLGPFPVFGAKAFAGIGDCLPDTITDRSIVIRLKRRARSETVERFRRRSVTPEAATLRDRIVAWAPSEKDALSQARPALPDELDDRAQDVWEPLLAIADLAGGTWPARARRAALALSGAEQREDESLGVRVLADVYRVFENRGADRLATSALLDELHGDEEGPWASYGRAQKPLKAAQLGRLLRPFGIHSRTLRYDDGTQSKGYLRESFESEWERYVTPVSRSEPSQRPNPHGYAENDHSEPSQWDGVENAANPHEYSDGTAGRFESAESRHSDESAASEGNAEPSKHGHRDEAGQTAEQPGQGEECIRCGSSFAPNADGASLLRCRDCERHVPSVWRG